MKIGVFDSGLGGLVITKALIASLPEYDYLYLGDTKHLPYGEKTSGRILKYTLDAMKFLIKNDCKLIIIACNTATSITLRYVQQKFIPEYAPNIKVLGVVIPTVENAVEDDVTSVGIIATKATVVSQIYKTELLKINPKLIIKEVATTKLVPLIEENDFSNMREILQQYIGQFKDINRLILGCTHYPLIKDYCRELLPETVKIISQDELMGDKLYNYLVRHKEISQKLSQNQQRQFYVTKLNEKATEVAERLINGIKITEISY